MAGHSKWHNIRHQKKKEDKRRAKLFSKLSRRISVAAREGGGDPDKNPDLRMAIEKAKDKNMPKENIERAIKRGTGELEGVDYESFTYEGYGPGGVALYFEITTDNRNRTASELRHILSENGGNLGQEGCVAWMFDERGQLLLKKDEIEKDSEAVMLDAIEAGAEDVIEENNLIRIMTDPQDYIDVKEQLDDEYDFSDSDIVMVPNNEVDLNYKEARKVLELMNELEEHDDIQEVYTNFNIPESVMQELNKEEIA
ncbi:YebC/PmpR family DNA-binding transcriptional regulator [Halarsenatibacter silvermanii]|uniref:Probable transcriptional regulatory protein SAMN04488692_10481 n=1 Tax=Halarsenatibacter silvermanii TaxID=321763 RepID=A0A1G9JST4_9FIRM|nr:YebC/PmpR family DNA-binding transcriptional regulator [Halarsenatibacter silvermanii]SDL40598.1 DNA-binding regulatory protein, YebC/PmpR family [Halarsenatibacter silvermanii]